MEDTVLSDWIDWILVTVVKMYVSDILMIAPSLNKMIIMEA